MEITKEMVLQLLTEMARISKNLLDYNEAKRIDCKLSDGLRKILDCRDMCNHLRGEFVAYSTVVEILKSEELFNDYWNIHFGKEQENEN